MKTATTDYPAKFWIVVRFICSIVQTRPAQASPTYSMRCSCAAPCGFWDVQPRNQHHDRSIAVSLLVHQLFASYFAGIHSAEHKAWHLQRISTTTKTCLERTNQFLWAHLVANEWRTLVAQFARASCVSSIYFGEAARDGTSADLRCSMPVLGCLASEPGNILSSDSSVLMWSISLLLQGWIREPKMGSNKYCLRRIRAHQGASWCINCVLLHRACFCKKEIHLWTNCLESGPASPHQEENRRGASWRISGASQRITIHPRYHLFYTFFVSSRRLPLLTTLQNFGLWCASFARTSSARYVPVK